MMATLPSSKPIADLPNASCELMRRSFALESGRWQGPTSPSRRRWREGDRSLSEAESEGWRGQGGGGPGGGGEGEGGGGGGGGGAGGWVSPPPPPAGGGAPPLPPMLPHRGRQGSAPGLEEALQQDTGFLRQHPANHLRLPVA